MLQKGLKVNTLAALQVQPFVPCVSSVAGEMALPSAHL